MTEKLSFYRLSFRGAAHRLACMRAYAPKGQTWREARSYGLHTYAAAFGLADIGTNSTDRDRVPVVYSFEESSLPVRDFRFADDVASIGHNGWFADARGYGDRGVIRGIVCRISHGRFLAGYHWSDNGEFVVFADAVYTDEDDAAGAADHLAESFAEMCRDDDERFRAICDAESQVEGKESDLCAAWADYKAVWSAYLQDARHAKAATRAREWVREMVADLRTARRDLKAARTAYEGV